MVERIHFLLAIVEFPYFVFQPNFTEVYEGVLDLDKLLLILIWLLLKLHFVSKVLSKEPLPLGAVDFNYLHFLLNLRGSCLLVELLLKCRDRILVAVL